MIKIKLDADSVVQQLEKISSDLSDAKPLMRKLAETMRFAVDRNFEEEGRPKWVPLRSREGKALRDTGALWDSINTAVTKKTAQVGTNEEYAAVHQFGTNKAGRGKNITIPARPFLQLTKRDNEALLSQSHHTGFS